MRRLPVLVTTVVAGLALLTPPAVAAGPVFSPGATLAPAAAKKAATAKAPATRPAPKGPAAGPARKKAAPVRKVVARPVVLTGFVSDTPTAVIGASDTSTVTIAFAVKSGPKHLRGLQRFVTTPTTGVRRDGVLVPAGALAAGDKVAVMVTRREDGVLVASRIWASSRERYTRD